MKFVPHNYQLEAINFMLSRPYSVAWLDCGLGKTVIALSVLAILKKRGQLTGKTLIVSIKRPVLSTWPNELKKWDHLQDFTYVQLCTKNKADFEKALETDADIYFINRDRLSSLVERFGSNWPFENVILDEMSSFKSPKSARTKALGKVRPYIKRMIGLTGTPASNGYEDLWAQFYILDKGERLGKSIAAYRNTYFRPGARNGHIIYNWILKRGSDKQIQEKVSDITISKGVEELKNMPELISNTVMVSLDDQELETYNELKNEYVVDILSQDEHNEITAASAGVLVNKLTQLASGLIYSDDANPIEFHQKKLEALLEITEAQVGKPFLLAYWYQYDLIRICKFLDKNDVKYVVIKTKEDEDKWNTGKYQIGIIQPASAGFGLNLQEGGACIVWYTLPWSLELYTQTNKRLHRQGQKAKRVIAHHLIAENTIDEKIYKALVKKENVQMSLLDALKKEGKLYERHK